MKLIIIILNFLILLFFIHWFLNGVYEGIKYGMSKHHVFFNFDLFDYFICISFLILLPFLNILINLSKIKNKFLLYLTTLKNFLILTFCILMTFFIIKDELNEDLNEWEKILNPINYEVITVIFCSGILLPSICIYLIYNNYIRRNLIN